MFKKVIAFFISFCFAFEQVGFAQIAGQLDISSRMTSMYNSMIFEKYRPLHLRYLSYDQLNNDFKLLLDKGSTKETKPEVLQKTTNELLKYFFIGIALPNDAFWVNLRPDSPKEIIDDNLAKTEIGKIMLECDLQLKKDTAKYTSPETLEGKEYWDKLYKRAEELYGSENITIPTLTRPWIVPDEIIVREAKGSAYIYKATLKVMLEQDYLKGNANYSFPDEKSKILNEYSSQIIRETIIPKLTREINSSKRYAPLRQVYYSLILAQWFKQSQKDTNSQVTSKIDTKDLSNLTSQSQWDKNTYFKAYQKSFKDGEYNIRENRSSAYGQTIRTYFSGGTILDTAPAIEAGKMTVTNIDPGDIAGVPYLASFAGNDQNNIVSSQAPIKAGVSSGDVQVIQNDVRPDEIKKFTKFLLKGNSDYFKEKYGTSNPEIIIEAPVSDVVGRSWQEAAAAGHWACKLYADRVAKDGLTNKPGEVYYGNINGEGEVVHISELQKIVRLEGKTETFADGGIGETILDGMFYGVTALGIWTITIGTGGAAAIPAVGALLGTGIAIGAALRLLFPDYFEGNDFSGIFHAGFIAALMPAEVVSFFVGLIAQYSFGEIAVRVAMAGPAAFYTGLHIGAIVIPAIAGLGVAAINNAKAAIDSRINKSSESVENPGRKLADGGLTAEDRKKLVTRDRREFLGTSHNANYILNEELIHPEASDEVLNKIDGAVLGSELDTFAEGKWFHGFDFVDVYDHFSSGLTSQLERLKKPIFYADLPMHKIFRDGWSPDVLDVTVKGAATLGPLAILVLVNPQIFGPVLIAGLLIFAARPFVMVSEDPLIHNIMGYVKLATGFYTPDGLRSAITANKIEEIIVPQLKEEIMKKEGAVRKPNILISYGDGYRDIVFYARHKWLRKMVIALNTLWLYFPHSFQYRNTVEQVVYDKDNNRSNNKITYVQEDVFDGTVKGDGGKIESSKLLTALRVRGIVGVIFDDVSGFITSGIVYGVFSGLTALWTWFMTIGTGGVDALPVVGALFGASIAIGIYSRLAVSEYFEGREHVRDYFDGFVMGMVPSLLPSFFIGRLAEYFEGHEAGSDYFYDLSFKVVPASVVSLFIGLIAEYFFGEVALRVALVGPAVFYTGWYIGAIAIPAIAGLGVAAINYTKAAVYSRIEKPSQTPENTDDKLADGGSIMYSRLAGIKKFEKAQAGSLKSAELPGKLIVESKALNIPMSDFERGRKVFVESNEPYISYVDLERSLESGSERGGGMVADYQFLPEHFTPTYYNPKTGNRWQLIIERYVASDDPDRHVKAVFEYKLVFNQHKVVHRAVHFLRDDNFDVDFSPKFPEIRELPNGDLLIREKQLNNLFKRVDGKTGETIWQIGGGFEKIVFNNEDGYSPFTVETDTETVDFYPDKAESAKDGGDIVAQFKKAGLYDRILESGRFRFEGIQRFDLANMEAAIRAVNTLGISITPQTIFYILDMINTESNLKQFAAVTGFEAIRGIAIAKLKEKNEGKLDPKFLDKDGLITAFRTWVILSGDVGAMIDLSRATPEQESTKDDGGLPIAQQQEKSEPGKLAVPDSAAAQSPLGGIDFRALPIITQPMGEVLMKEIVNMPKVNIADLDQEWQSLQKMIAADACPSTERIKEFLGACYQKGELKQRADKVLACLAGMLRIEEDEYKATEPQVKVMLALLEYNR